MASTPESIHSLLAQARAGNEQAVNRLFSRCRGYLAVIARAELDSRLLVKCDESDLVQQTLLEAHQGLGGFAGASEAEWLAWLRRILQRNVTDVARAFRGTDKRQLDAEIPRADMVGSPSEPAWEPADLAPSPSRQVLAAEEQLRLADALLALPDDYRAVIIARHFDHLPFDKIGESLGRSRPAAQMLWMRAVARLREILDDELPLP